jgi:hypothetical protein
MTFFYNLNKKLDTIRATPELTHKQLNERDMSRAAKGYEKYGKEGMEALAKAGREGKSLDPVRAKYDKYDNKEVDEGMGDMIKKAGGMAKKVGGAILDKVGHGSDADMIRDLQRKMGVPQTGMKPGAEPNPKQVKEVTAPIDFDKVLNAIAALYGDDMWENDAMQDLANDLAQAGPTDRELDFIIAKGRLPKRLANTQFSAGDNVQFGEGSSPMTPKQKSFAKLAPPADKITFADKIAGAKKEVDERLGDVAAEAIKGALSPKQKKMAALGGNPKRIDGPDLAALRKGADMGEDDDNNPFTSYKKPRKDVPQVGSVERGAKHDIKHTATGRMVTRRTDDQGYSVGADDASDAEPQKRGRGRPSGTGSKMGAKGPSGKSKLMTKENDRDPGEYDQEGDMAKDSIKTVVRHAQALEKILGDNDNLPEWVQSKLAKIESMMTAVDDYMQNQEGDNEEMAVGEESTNKRDTHAEKAGKKVTKDIEYDEKKKDGIHGKKRGSEDEKAEKAGKKVTKDIEYDEKKDKKEDKPKKVKEQGGTDTPTASSGFSFGQGIYDSMNRELEKMIAESMSVNMSDSTEGGKSLTITATDEDALKLAGLLKNAGLGGGEGMGQEMDQGEESCPSCGMNDCGCGDIDEALAENNPDWPTDQETSDDALQYSGGLNGPKSTGQTTIPVIASQENRQATYEEDEALRRMMEMAGVQQDNLKPWERTMKEDAEEDAEDAEEDAEDAEDKLDESFEQMLTRMRDIAGIREAKKPDFLDIDKDGDKKEPMKKAVADKEKKVDESIFALTNQWKAYKG